jgi:Flp pilus assembly protein TadG
MKNALSHSFLRNLGLRPGSFVKNEEGTAAIEFGFVVPFLFLLFFGLVDLTGLISTSRKVTNASAVIADLVSQNNAAFPKSQLEDYLAAVQMILPDRSPSEIRMQVFAYRMVGAAPARQWSYDSGTGPACAGNIETSRMPDLMTGPNDLIVARVCVTYLPYFGTWKGSPVLGSLSYNVRETTITRPRTRNVIECSDCTKP